ncbi:Uncharacterized membrane protein [Anaerosphaera aminiphila DSM 21120]|uniref:Uncharacterized membrane protein n=1 Tax=Anaerosphaera aminiphila DSM 21120 TaxID=1120995 RepID=A0A1M5P0R8_9FIRM|nr:ECF transporter S component [Anaerosphaera aminiphila]SHG95416.1 Uncharacterized membrane protein [Anaerosphaera aminiphila DSM 21120]
MKIRELVLSALGLATVYILTVCIAIPVAGYGYINVGDAAIYVFSFFVPPHFAFLLAGIGSALADLSLGYSHYFIFSLIIKGTMGFVVSKLIKKYYPRQSIITYLVGSSIVLIGYFFAGWILYGTLASGLLTLVPNLVQVVVSSVLSYVIFKMILKDKDSKTIK